MRIHEYLAGDFQNAKTPSYEPPTNHKKQEEMYKNLIDHTMKRYIQQQTLTSVVDKFLGDSKKQEDVTDNIVTSIFMGIPKRNIVKKLLRL